MNEDLMSTQTGGEGQTIQAMPDTNPTPADFSANINPQQVQNPPVQVPTVEQTAGVPQVQIPNQEAQSATALIQPTNENVPQMPTQQPEETKVDVPEGYTDEWYNEITNPPVSEQQAPVEVPTEEPKQLETINGAKQFTEEQPVIKQPKVEVKQPTKIETINGQKQFTEPVIKTPEEQKVQKEYKKAGINVQPLEKKQDIKYGKEDRDYTYDGRIYRKQDGNWLVYNKAKDAFVRFDPRTDVKGRYAVLEKKAAPYKKPDSLGIASSVLKQSIGDITGEIPQAMQTNGLGMNMEMLNRSAMGTPDMERNFDGTKNFNYDPNVAQASKGAQGLLTYKPSVVKKKDITSKIPNVVTGISSLTKDPIEKALDFNEKVKEEKARRENNYRNTVLEQANNFVNKNISLTAGKSLTAEQTENLISQQQEVKKILSKEVKTDNDILTLKNNLNKTNQFLIKAQENNNTINQAAREGKSIGQYYFDKKKEQVDNTKDESVINTFKATSGIANYINTLVDGGKARWDKQKDKYVFSDNLPKSERDFYNSKIKQLNSEYYKSQQEERNYIYEKTDELRNNKANIESDIRLLSAQLSKMDKDSDGYTDKLNQIESRKKQLLFAEKKINELEGRKLAVLRTDAKAIVKNMAGSISDASKDIYSAIPQNISSKVKFDMYYDGLLDRQDYLAKTYNIRTDYLSRLSQAAREVLDWEDLGIELSEQEKEYLQNQSQLNQLAPVYFNNTTGITKSTDGFFSSFWNGMNNFLFPLTSRADSGDIRQSEQAGTIANTLKELNISKEDLVNEDTIKDLEKRSVVKLLSPSGLGYMGGTSAAIVLALESSPGFAGIAKFGNGLVKLTKAYDIANKSKKVIEVGAKIHDRVLNSGKFGKFFVNAAKMGAKSEIAGRIYGSTGSELNASIGIAGVVGSELMGGIISKLPAQKILPYLSSIFGEATPKVVSVLGRAGQFVTTGTVGIAEETMQEIAGIYADENRKNGLFDAVKERFPDFNSVQEFCLSAMIMEGVFSLSQVNKARELYDAMPQKQKDEINSVITDVATDFQKANEAVEDFADEVTDVEEKKKAIDKAEPKKEEKKETKVEPEGEDEIIFDVGDLSKIEPETEITEELPVESTFTQPIDFTNDKENEQGVSGEEREGEKLVETEPVAKPSEEEVSPSGVVQEEQEVAETPKAEEKPAEAPKAEEGLSTEEVEGRDEIINSKGKITTTKPARIFKGLFGKKNPDGTVRTAHPDVKGTWGALDKKLAEKYRENEDEELKEFEIPAGTTVETIEIPMKGLTIDQYRKLETDAINGSDAQIVKLITKDATAKMQTQMVIKDANISGYKPKTEEQVSADPFTDLKEVNKHGIRSAKRKEAVADFDAKHGEGAYNRVSKIDANFDNIISKLEKNNLIEKEC